MGNGNNEKSWQVKSWPVISAPEQVDVTNPLSLETFAVQKNAAVLYYIKESLKLNGWEVMSSSYRTDATGSSGSAPDFYPTQSLTAYGQNAAVLAVNKVKFTVADGDKWLTQSSDYGAINPSNNTIDVRSMYRIIYPCYSTSSAAASPDSIHTSSAGRSWVLMKNTSSLAQNGKPLYLVLDYLGGFRGSYLTSSKLALTSSFVTGSLSVQGHDQNQLFGSAINIAMFYPEAGSEYSGTPFKRPNSPNEITFSKNYVVAGTSAENGSYNEWQILTNPGAAGNGVHVNHIYCTETSGSYTIVSEDAQVRYILGIDIMGNSLSSSIASKSNVGSVFIMSYSSFTRNKLNKASIATPTSGGKYFITSDILGAKKGGDGESNAAVDSSGNASNTSRPYTTPYELLWVPSIKYFANISDTSNSPSSLLTAFPIYASSGTIGTVQAVYSSIHGFLNYTSKESSATYDGTYVEFPLPLLDVSLSTDSIRYAGRLTDVKLGPADGQNGTLAQATVGYDRILLDGFWFPYSGSTPMSI